MHFRVRKNVIQLIRTTYNGSKKKGDNTIVGTVQMSSPELSKELHAKLTAPEITAFENWLETQHRADLIREQFAALTLAESLTKATKWFEREGNTTVARTVAADLVLHWQTLRKTLAKNGLLE
jgi:hypothetical protein